MIKLILTPQRNDMIASYTAVGDVLAVTGAAGEDSFDFSSLTDGDIATDFVSSLNVCPVISAECSIDDGERVITVSAISWYGADADDELKQGREVIL